MSVIATDTTTTHNHDILMLYDLTNRFIVELHKAQSSSSAGMTTFDIARVKSYNGALITLHQHIQSQPELDLPETSPHTYALEPRPEVTNVNNESSNYIIRLYCLAREELINSDSSRRSSRLNPYDSARFLGIVEKCEKFVADYVEQVTPIDLPESSPAAPISGPGNRGV